MVPVVVPSWKSATQWPASWLAASAMYFSEFARRSGKTSGGGDRVPSPAEIAASRGFLEREVAILRPRLVLPVGRLAIEQVLGAGTRLDEVVGEGIRHEYHGVSVDVIALPHPSGASTWFKVEPGRTLLERALARLGRHPEVRRAFPRRGR